MRDEHGMEVVVYCEHGGCFHSLADLGLAVIGGKTVRTVMAREREWLYEDDTTEGGNDE